MWLGVHVYCVCEHTFNLVSVERMKMLAQMKLTATHNDTCRDKTSGCAMATNREKLRKLKTENHPYLWMKLVLHISYSWAGCNFWRKLCTFASVSWYEWVKLAPFIAGSHLARIDRMTCEKTRAKMARSQSNAVLKRRK